MAPLSFVTLALSLALATGCTKSKPPAPLTSNHAAGSSVVDDHKAGGKPADSCVEARSCQACIEASCQWDIGKQACAKHCDEDAKNCLLVGADHIGAEAAGEVCAGARQ
ncbi:MAG: hypothetical protein H6Q90_2939 [Deltaproteobacteria bacterium]|nr:hypothetical protein [Deltaproteobacteria bacterium]